MLLRPCDWSLAQSSDAVLRKLSGELTARITPETHAAVVELATGVHAHLSGVALELGSVRTQLKRELAAMGLSVAAAGTHPLTVWQETEVSGSDRYQRLGDSLRVLARREPTLALHVHVGIPDPEDAVRVLNGLRRHAPLLLALSASSPFWQGRDSGLASARTMIFQAFPRSGLPRFFADYGDYVKAIDPLIASGAISDPSFLWWDVRLQPALGTVEVRAMDAQTTIGETAPIVALIQSLARLELEGSSSSVVPSAEVLAENRFLATRDGMDARLIDPGGRGLIPARQVLNSLLTECRPHAHALGCSDALDQVDPLAAANGAVRQRAFVARGGRLDELVSHLADRFLAPNWPAGLGREVAEFP